MRYILLRDVVVEAKSDDLVGRRFYNANSFVARRVYLKMEMGKENLTMELDNQISDT